MKTAIEFDTTAKATAKQIYFIGRHFAQLAGSNPQEVWGLSKRFPAAMLKWNAEHSETPITMGDIDTWKSGTKVPQKFLKMVTVQKPRVTVEAKASPKPEPKASKPAPKPKASKAKATEAPKPKASELPLGEFKEHFEKITGRVFKLEKGIEDHSKKLALLDAKLDMIMAFIQEDPEA